MNEAALKARKAYKREWAKKNPEKVKAYQEKYWNKKAAEAATIKADAETQEQGA